MELFYFALSSFRALQPGEARPHSTFMQEEVDFAAK
jgi:hypothetical protein